MENVEKKEIEDNTRHYDMWDVRKHIAFKRKKNYTVISDQTKAILNDYEVLPKHIARFWSVFNKLDSLNIGYITVDKILLYLSEREYSIVAPFCYRFFELIDKELADRVSF